MHWGKEVAYFVVFIIFGILSPIWGVMIFNSDKECVRNTRGKCKVDDKGCEIPESTVFAGLLYWTFGALYWGYATAKLFDANRRDLDEEFAASEAARAARVAAAEAAEAAEAAKAVESGY
jgi:hypothetical protein